MKTIMRNFARALTFIMLVSAHAWAQPADKPVLRISGEVLTPLNLTVDDLAKMPTAQLKTKDRDGKEHTYSGVALFDVLMAAGVTLGPELRGENMAKYVVISAADNYQVVYALPELDKEFTGNVVLLATAVDGQPLPKGEGPFRLVNPGDKKHGRWIREIRSIRIGFAQP